MTRTTEEQIKLAIERGKIYERDDVRAIGARYDASLDKVSISLNTCVNLQIPRDRLQGLAAAKPRALRNISISPQGQGICFEDLDTGFTIEGLLAGAFGDERWMSALAAHVMGSSRSAGSNNDDRPR
ncbi:MAG: hypothetical protein NVSMB64_10620 [Candidatus Velthaea sp.]